MPVFDLAQRIVLAQSNDLFGQVAPWLAILLGVVIVGGAAIFVVRKRVFGDDGPSSAGGFTLHDLRQLHASGELSDEEFQRARDQMIGRVRAQAMKDDDATNSESPSSPDRLSESAHQSDSDPQHD